MMNLMFKNILLAYLAFGLVAAPSEVLAAHKKPSKRLVSNQKHLSQTGRIRAQQVSVRLRSAHSLQFSGALA